MAQFFLAKVNASCKLRPLDRPRIGSRSPERKIRLPPKAIFGISGESRHCVRDRKKARLPKRPIRRDSQSDSSHNSRSNILADEQPMQCDKAFRRKTAEFYQNHTKARIAKIIGGPTRTSIRVRNVAVGSGARQTGQRN